LSVLAVGVAPDGRGGLRTGRPQRLFAAPALFVQPQANAFAYSPHPDEQRFLMNAPYRRWRGVGEAGRQLHQQLHQVRLKARRQLVIRDNEKPPNLNGMLQFVLLLVDKDVNRVVA
jgi:hypothetical protein